MIGDKLVLQLVDHRVTNGAIFLFPVVLLNKRSEERRGGKEG